MVGVISGRNSIMSKDAPPIDYLIDERTTFLDKGFIIVRGLFNSEEVALMQRALVDDASFEAHAFPRVDRNGLVVKVAVWNHPGASVLGWIARSARIVNRMELFLCDSVYHYHSKVPLKEAQNGGA